MAPEFDWDDDNVDHIAVHGIDRDEAEQAYKDKHRRYRNVYATREARKGMLGRTEAGRLLFLVFTIRASKIRVVSARTADAAEKRYYKGK